MPTVSAVVSLFNPDGGVLANASSLLRQVDTVVVVDDGSPEDPSSVLADLAELGCVVLRLDRNSGIASALNAGIRVALRQDDKPDFVLTMDQDSLLADGYVPALTGASAAASAANVPVGLVGPGTILGLPVRRAGAVNGIVIGGEPIQSGLLIPVAVLERVGLFQDNLFIDGVDSEFYLRCAAAGLRTVVAVDAELQHSLGSPATATLFGKAISFGGQPLQVRTAAVWRYYYLFRNRLILTRKYGRKFPLWALKGFLADYRHLLIVTLLAPGRLKRLSNALSGIVDGVRGVSGARRT